MYTVKNIFSSLTPEKTNKKITGYSPPAMHLPNSFNDPKHAHEVVAATTGGA